MENDKLFGFMEKIYDEMQQGFKGVNNRIDGLENRINGIENELKKNSIRLEALEKKVDVIAEVQSNHIRLNEINHNEIFETLNSKIELTQKAVSKISAANS